VHTAQTTGRDDPALWELAAGGFRDTSRVAASDTKMFLDILMTNQPAVLAQLDEYIHHLCEFRSLLESDNEDALAAKLKISQQLRAQWKPRRG
jgi:prephenate dehydrogenase